MKQKRIIKKIAKIGLTLMLIFGGSYLIGKQKTANYSDINDVYKIAEALDTDTAVITNSGTNDPVRLQHNGEEPIYIAIDNEFSDGQKEGINQAIDYVFGIVNSINSNYTYEIVENTEAAEKFLRGKTVIYYNLGYDYKYSAGSIFSAENIFTITAGCSLRNIARINIEEEDWAIDNIVENSIHELLHAFGFDDVYTSPPYPWIQKTDRYYNTK